ncbi:MAG: hypothetical protein WCH46_04345 [bacterium]
MKFILRNIFVLLIALLATYSTIVAQKNAKPPALTISVPQIRFGAQAVGIESCIKISITNPGNVTQKILQLNTENDRIYSIPSPSQQMLPMNIQPHQTLEISVCFKPVKFGEFPSRLVVRTASDSTIIPISGKGMKTEDISKLPKNDLTIIKPSKKGKGEWTFKLRLISSSKISLQLFDDLGVMCASILNSDLKNEGVYELPFDGLDKQGKKLPSGTYYLRCTIEDIVRANQMMKFTKVVEIGK